MLTSVPLDAVDADETEDGVVADVGGALLLQARQFHASLVEERQHETAAVAHPFQTRLRLGRFLQ